MTKAEPLSSADTQRFSTTDFQDVATCFTTDFGFEREERASDLANAKYGYPPGAALSSLKSKTE
jgi:hypothetical protein